MARSEQICQKNIKAKTYMQAKKAGAAVGTRQCFQCNKTTIFSTSTSLLSKQFKMYYCAS
jgi:hypothetical protein